MNADYRRNQLWGLFSATALYWIIWSMLRPIMTLYLQSFNLEAGVIGLILSLQTLLPFVLAMPIGTWIDRLGTRVSVWSGLLVFSISLGMYIVSGNVKSHVYVVCGMILIGVSSLLIWGALQAAAAEMATRGEEKGKNKLMSNFSFVNSLMQFIGPGLGGLLVEKSGYVFVFYLCSVVAVGIAVISFWLPAKKAERFHVSAVSFDLLGSYKNGLRMLARNKAFAMAIVLNGLLFILLDLRMTFFPLYLNESGISASKIGFMLSVGALATVIVRPMAGFLLNRIRNVWLSAGCLGIGAICLMSLALNPPYAVMMAIVFIWSASTGINQPVSMIMVANSVREGQQGMGMSLRSMSNRAAEFVNPALFGVMTGFIGLSMSFALIGFLLMAVGGSFVYLSLPMEGTTRSVKKFRTKRTDKTG